MAIIEGRIFTRFSAEQYRHLGYKVAARVDGLRHLQQGRRLQNRILAVFKRIEEAVVLESVVSNVQADALHVVVAGLQCIAHDRFIRQIFILLSAIDGDIAIVDGGRLHAAGGIRQQIGRRRLRSHHLRGVLNIIKGVHISQLQAVAPVRHLADGQRIAALTVQRRVAEVLFRDRQSAAEKRVELILLIEVLLGDAQLARTRAAEQLHDHLSLPQLFLCIHLPRRAVRRVLILHRQLQRSGDRGAGRLGSVCRRAPCGAQLRGVIGVEAHRADGTLLRAVSVTHIQVTRHRNGVVGILVKILQIQMHIHIVRVGADGVQFKHVFVGLHRRRGRRFFQLHAGIGDLVCTQLQLQRLRGVDSALTAAQCNAQRTLIHIIICTASLVDQRDLGHAVALGLHFLTSSKVIAHRFFIVVKGHLDLEAVHLTGRHGELHRLAGAGGDGTLQRVFPGCSVLLIGRVGIAHRTAVRVNDRGAEHLKHTGYAVVVYRELVGLFVFRGTLQRHDLQLLLCQRLKAALRLHIYTRHIGLVVVQTGEGHLLISAGGGERHILLAHVLARITEGAHVKGLGLLRRQQIHRCLLDAGGIVRVHRGQEGHAVLCGLLISQMHAGGIRVEHAPDKFAGIHLTVGCVVCRHGELILRVRLQRIALGIKLHRRIRTAGVEVKVARRSRGVKRRVHRVAVHRNTGGDLCNGHPAGVFRRAAEIADLFQRLTVIRYLDRTVQSRSGHLPLGYAHRRQRTVGGTHCHGVLTAGTVTAVGAAFAAGAACARRTGSAVLTGAAGGAGRALLSGLTVRTILTVRAVNCLDIQLGNDLPPRLQLRQHNGILRRHRQLCHRQLIGTAVNELGHRIDLYALIRFDIAFLGNGHPQVIRCQQMYDVVGRDHHLHIVLHLADVPL